MDEERVVRAPRRGGTVAEKEALELNGTADTCITKHALLAGAAGLIPSPLADFAGVTAVQFRMILELSEIYGVKVQSGHVKKLIVTMAGAKLSQTIYRLLGSAIKMLPGPGTVAGEIIQGVISVTVTYAMGKAANSERPESQPPGSKSRRPGRAARSSWPRAASLTARATGS